MILSVAFWLHALVLGNIVQNQYPHHAQVIVTNRLSKPLYNLTVTHQFHKDDAEELYWSALRPHSPSLPSAPLHYDGSSWLTSNYWTVSWVTEDNQVRCSYEQAKYALNAGDTGETVFISIAPTWTKDDWLSRLWVNSTLAPQLSIQSSSQSTQEIKCDWIQPVQAAESRGAVDYSLVGVDTLPYEASITIQNNVDITATNISFETSAYGTQYSATWDRILPGDLSLPRPVSVKPAIARESQSWALSLDVEFAERWPGTIFRCSTYDFWKWQKDWFIGYPTELKLSIVLLDMNHYVEGLQIVGRDCNDVVRLPCILP